MPGNPAPINRAFAQALRQTRKAKGLTQEDFSLISGRTYISSLERGLKSPTLEKIMELAETLSSHPLTLLTLTYLHAHRNETLEQVFARVQKEVKNISQAAKK